MNKINYQVGKRGAHINGRLMGEIKKVRKDTLLVEWNGGPLLGTRISEIKKEKFNQW